MYKILTLIFALQFLIIFPSCGGGGSSVDTSETPTEDGITLLAGGGELDGIKQLEFGETFSFSLQYNGSEVDSFTCKLLDSEGEEIPLAESGTVTCASGAGTYTAPDSLSEEYGSYVQLEVSIDLLNIVLGDLSPKASSGSISTTLDLMLPCNFSGNCGHNSIPICFYQQCSSLDSIGIDSETDSCTDGQDCANGEHCIAYNKNSCSTSYCTDVQEYYITEGETCSSPSQWIPEYNLCITADAYDCFSEEEANCIETESCSSSCGNTGYSDDGGESCYSDSSCEDICIPDTTNPTVTITSNESTLTATNPFSITVTFSEPVEGFDLLDFSLTNADVSNLVEVTSGRVFTVDVTPAGDPSNVSIYVQADSANDSFENGNEQSNTFSIRYDSSELTVSMNTSGASYANAPFDVNIVFSEEVTSFDASDITPSSGSVTNLSTEDNITFVAEITPASDGTVTIAIAEGAATDALTEVKTSQAASSISIIYDTGAPTADSFSPADESADVSVDPTFVVTFSETMDTSTITTNTSNSSCSGSIQVSSDNFSTCVQMSTTPVASTNDTVFTITPASSLSGGTTYKIKVTTSASDLAGNGLSEDAVTASGFTTISLVVTSAISGDWNDTNTWEGDTIPEAGEDVVIAHEVTIGSESIANINDLTINSGGTLIQNNALTLTIAGDLTVADGGTLKHGNNSTEQLYEVNFTAVNMTIAGTINVDRLGYENGSPGYSPDGTSGGGVTNPAAYVGGGGAHGGNGGHGDGANGNDAAGGTLYAIASSELSTMGAGGGNGSFGAAGGDGGGFIKLVASGELNITGSITANGGNGNKSDFGDTAGGGAGGGIFIQGNIISGTPTLLSANGGDAYRETAVSYDGGGGGGGVIYIAYESTCSITADDYSVAGGWADVAGGAGLGQDGDDLIDPL